jgi:ribonuclease HI
LPLTLTNAIGSTTMKLVEIYTDGACSGNPGPGGYGVILKSNGNTKELSQGFKNTTNNRMELRAVIEGLKALKEKCNVLIYSDSKYIVDAVEKGWARRWEANNWYRNKKEKALNIDLWLDLLDLLDKHQVRFRWVKGHAGHPENELCDQMAVAAAAGENLFDDI